MNHLASTRCDPSTSLNCSLSPPMNDSAWLWLGLGAGALVLFSKVGSTIEEGGVSGLLTGNGDSSTPTTQVTNNDLPGVLSVLPFTGWYYWGKEWGWL